jgi:hypothetical protein
MRLKRMLMSLSVILVGLGVGSADAAVIMDQDFDDTGTFSPGITGNVGDAANTGGRWGVYDLTNIRISNTVALSGSQSTIVTRGGAAIGRTDAVVTTDVYEVSYAINRESSDSEFMLQVGNNLSVSGALDLATFTRANGQIYIWAGGWSATTASAPVGEWTGVRMLVDELAMSYDLFVTPQGGSEAFVQTVSMAGAPTNVNAVRMNPQGVSGTVTYFDDVLINEVPEPATLGLMSLGGLLLLRRGRFS